MSNLATRTISGIIFLLVIITALRWRAEAYGLIFFFITCTMMCEYIRISTGKIRNNSQMLAVLSGAALFVISYLITADGIDLKWLCIIPVLTVMTISSVLFGANPDDYSVLPYLLAPITYIAIPFSMCNVIVFSEGNFNALPLLAILIMLWSSDVGAYVFGLTLRNVFPKKLCPSISPKKTVVGYAGGLVVTLLAGVLISTTGVIDCSVAHSLGLALIVNITGTIGDLAESQFKRHFNVKDSGTIMPGHGGLLDRFDGALLAFPAAISYLLLIN